MRVDSAGLDRLVEDQAVVTQAEMAQIGDGGDGQPSLRARHPDISDPTCRNFPTVWSIMPSAPSDESKFGMTVEYVLVPEDADEAENADRNDQPPYAKKRARSWFSIFLCSWLVITYVEPSPDCVPHADFCISVSHILP